MFKFSKKENDISIVLCGAAGQGIQTVEQFLVRLFKISGYNIFATKEYMSRVRGGCNSTELRVSSNKVKAFVDRIDILVPFNTEAFEHIEKRISLDTIIIGERHKFLKDQKTNKYQIVDVPFSDLAKKVGGAIYTNIIIVGIFAALFEIERKVVDDLLRKAFQEKGEKVIERNIVAIDEGYEIGTQLLLKEIIKIDLNKDSGVTKDIIINGGQAVGLGAIAGGCNFISSYPMTPSTPVLTFLAQQSKSFDIIAEQAEDEIAAMNMALGAWYAGGRALVTTSGGGFALMAEGLSLAGMIESPIVIHLAQRPGPATGLPTRTEQGDLLFALHAGHGEFPRIILAPGTLEDAFHFTQKAFNLADRYQIPVFVLTDQYFIDSYYNIPELDPSKLKIEKHIVKTDKNYKRYMLTQNGISPRGIPGHGEGLVAVDSDEHDEEGHITENHDVRINMVNKRLKKYDRIIEEAIPPRLTGKGDYKILIVCWGSVVNIVIEALQKLNQDDVALLHFGQVYPLHPKTYGYFKKVQKTIIIENNATAQFAQILKVHGDIDIQTKILKYNGLPYSVEEIYQRLKEVLQLS
jgi:2-oxoglutarate ferredoxin oxidoreductase subunit alpha